MIPINFIEMHCTHACNLHCIACGHFSNNHVGGHVTVKEAEEQLLPWKKIIKPEIFSITGGEPALNPELPKFLEMCRKHWPKQKIMLTSNGLLLPKLHPDLGRVLEKYDIRLVISKHHNSKSFCEEFDESYRKVCQWKQFYNFKLELRKAFLNWEIPYFGQSDKITPYNHGDWKASWNCCLEKECRYIYDGKIWKCTRIGCLKHQSKYFTLSSAWDPYLKYIPLSPQESKKNMIAFFKKQAEPVCGMCSTDMPILNLPDPRNKSLSCRMAVRQLPTGGIKLI